LTLLGIHPVADNRPQVRPPLRGHLHKIGLIALVSMLLMGGPAVVAGDIAAAEDPAPAAASAPASGGMDQAPRPLQELRPLVAKPLSPSDLPPPSIFSPRSLPRSVNLTIEPKGDGDQGAYRAVIDREAASYGVPPELVDAVMSVESSYNPATVGADGEIGLMQLMPATAQMLGFTGTPTELAVPETNIHYGVLYLAVAWRLAGQDICTATMKYRAGHGETRFSVRSVDYCLKVRSRLAARGFRVTGLVPQATFGLPAGGGSRGPLLSQRVPGVDLQALNATLHALTSRVAVGPLH
jgi:hypothetical protein